MKNALMTALAAMIGMMTSAALPEVRNVKALQPYPWENKVYISYEVAGDIAAGAESGNAPVLFVAAKDRTTGIVYGEVSAITGYLTGDTGAAEGEHKVVWDIAAQGLTVNSDNVVFTVMYCDEPPYLMVDLSSGASSSYYSVSYLYGVPSGCWTDAYKTTKLVLRRIAPGSFRMCGSYNVTLTKPYYIGVFEVTQKQYTLVMGSNPSSHTGDKRPVTNVSYFDCASFTTKLRARTGLDFCLPTEAQWEYACRAGRTDNGGPVGRYSGNWSDGLGGYSDYHTTVGSYLSNAWGLYDMLGNVWELCNDWYGNLSDATDPQGPSSGSGKVVRGGSCDSSLSYCSSSSRGNGGLGGGELGGFRIVRNLSNE